MDITLTVEITAGCHIRRAAEQAIALANKLGVWVRFKFNDVDCNVAPGSDAGDLVAEFDAARKGETPSGCRLAFAHQRHLP